MPGGAFFAERGYSCAASDERGIARDVEEKPGYIAVDSDTEMEWAVASSGWEETYELPGGNVASMTSPTSPSRNATAISVTPCRSTKVIPCRAPGCALAWRAGPAQNS